MKNELEPYECQFTIEERKKITARMLKEIRTAKNYSQKQVAAFIKVKPTTYNTYENGRTEPPIEILVRLSYLYQTPIDIIVQKDRLYRTEQDINKLLDEYKKELAEIEKQMTEGGEDNPILKSMRESMNNIIDQLKKLNDNNTQMDL